ncbi:hypothetical protein SOVF_101090 [Spinacia oleracea]|uniref:Uncharacterized protein n=1 Tax=Spinacia oleracea TaxID=3562 RepID=A0ABM3QHN4_SPIOL|nr:uncharacterized protein LOC130459495 [Spinacia oleracea]KNA15129.1 hypothetical protein SOVF_101090 [Spinacia oleracea]
METCNNSNNKLKIIHSRMVTIDEDELECLRKLAEPKPTTTNHRRQKVTPPPTNTRSSRLSTGNCNNNIKISNDDHHHHFYEENKKKLESKKSEDINESAEKFIQKFKQQLLLQRLESIENVEQMLERGL